MQNIMCNFRKTRSFLLILVVTAVVVGFFARKEPRISHMNEPVTEQPIEATRNILLCI